MKTHLAACVLALTAVSLGACTQPAGGGARANAGLCADFKTPRDAPLASTDGAAAVEDCARRWAYSLAPSDDAAEVVAEAVAGACSAQLSRWNQQTLAQPNGDAEAASILTGQSTTPLAEHNAFTQARALFYVVQARAGRCAAPPIKNGVPEGLS